jgi:hypothetical protein
VTPPLLETALKYAERGFRVFPLRDSGDDGNRKLPQHKDWPNVATCDAKTIRRWWMLTPGAGIGIATGAGLLVLDIDRKNGKDGDASLAALIAEHGEFPATLSATTPNGGTHYYLRGPADLRNSACKIGDGLDIRAHHGYVVAPSHARCGSGYAWRNDEEIADAPLWLVHAAMAHEKREPVETAPAVKVDAKLAAEIRSAANALNPDDYDTWIFVGHALFSLGAFGREVWLTWSQQSAKWQPSDARRWETFAASQIEYQALFARAQRQGWCNPMAGSSAASVATSAEPPISTLVDVAIPHDFMTADLPPPRFVIVPGVPADEVTLWSGNGGSAKTTTVETIGAHGACSREFAGFKMLGDNRRVVIVTLEDPAPVVLHRLQRTARAHKLDVHALRENLTVLDGTRGDATLMRRDRHSGGLVETKTLCDLRERVRQLAPALVVVDGVSDGYAGEENDRHEVRVFVRTLAQMVREIGAGLILLQHIDKAAVRNGAKNNSTYSGSTQWHNSARSRFAQVKGDDGTVTITHEKNNRGPLAPPITLRWNADGVLVPVEAAGDGAHGAAALVASADAEHVYTALVAAQSSSVNVPTGRVGASTAQNVLATCGLPPMLCGAAGRRRFWAAVDFLLSQGCAECAEYVTEQRKPRVRLVPIVAPNVRCAESPITPVHSAHGVRADAPNCADSDSARIRRNSAQSNKPRRDHAA